MSWRWEQIEDGYHVEWRLVDSATGRILGGVRGEAYAGMKSSYHAHQNNGGDRNIGDFVTKDYAMRAVEAAVKSGDKKEED
jgi:hypothetical protein